MPPTLPPYTASHVRSIIRTSAQALTSAPTHYRHEAPGGLVITARAHPGTWENLGPAIDLGVWHAGQLLAYASIERDIEIEADEGWGPAWVLQSLFVLPEMQRQGIGTLLLHTARQITGLAIAEDTQMTETSSALYAKLRDDLWPPHAQPRPTTDPAVIAFRLQAEEIVAAAFAAWSRS